MADGYRILENGDSRFTEASDNRITEQFEVGEAALTSTGSKASVGIAMLWGVAELTGVGSASPQATLSAIASSSTTGIGTVAPTGAFKGDGISSFTATGTLDSTAIMTLYPDSSLSGVGTIVPNRVNTIQYIKIANIWETITPYVKYEGSWIEPHEIYKNVSGTWTRVYLR